MNDAVVDLQKKLVCFGDRDDVLFMILFGSRARGDYTEKSDLDIGVLYTEQPDLLVVGGDISRIEELTEIKTDLVVLNGLPEKKPELAYHIASEAKLMYARDIELFFIFKTRCYTSYFDFLPLKKRSLEFLDKRIKNGSYARPIYAKST